MPSGSNAGQQPINKFNLPREYLLACVSRSEPLRAIDFGKLLLASALRRPFQLECIRLQLRDRKVSFERPCDDLFLARLHQHTQIPEVAARLHPQLLAKLASCRGKRLLAVLTFSLRDRPCPKVLLGPERTTRVNQEQEKLLSRSFVHQDSCASLFHSSVKSA